MTSSDPRPFGSVVTFYSYKGGTGRTMALANVACLLGAPRAEGERVLMVDWDLEAPGLHRYFNSPNSAGADGDQPGLIDLFIELRRLTRLDSEFRKRVRGDESWIALDQILRLDQYIQRGVAPGVDLMRAGRFTADGSETYAERVASFDWAEFYRDSPECFQAFRLLLCHRYAHVLVDSRTGVGDVSGICTMILPERLVAVFTPNEQSLSGLLDLVAEAIAYRRASDDFRPLIVFPLPSRIEENEYELRTEWRERYQEAFEQVFRTGYGLDECNLSPYFDEVSIPHRGFFAYGEKVAVRSERGDALSLRRAYERFFDHFDTLSAVWEMEVPPVRPAAPSTPAYDVFLEWSGEAREESDFVWGLAEWLDAQGVRAFYAPRDILPGDDIQLRILSALDESRTLAILVGPGSNAHYGFGELLGKEGRRIIPVLISGASPHDIPAELRTRRWVDLRGGLGDRSAVAMLVNGILGRTDHEGGIGAGLRRIPLSSEELPVSPAHFERVAAAFASGGLTPVLGIVDDGGDVGLSRTADPFGARSIDRDGLADFLVSRFDYPSDEPRDLPRLCQFVETMYSRSHLEDTLLSYRSVASSPVHTDFVSMERSFLKSRLRKRPTVFISTSYDDRLEKTFALTDTPFDTIIVGARAQAEPYALYRKYKERGARRMHPEEMEIPRWPVILKIQGDVEERSQSGSRPVLTEDDYLSWAHHQVRRNLPLWLIDTLRDTSLLFIGYDVRDWTTRVTVRRLVGLLRTQKRFDVASAPEIGWAIASDSSAYARRLWERHHVEQVNFDPKIYVDELRRIVSSFLR